MFYSFVEEKVKELYNEIVIGNLFVNLDSIIEFVYFYCVSNTLQQENVKKYSLYSFLEMLSDTQSVSNKDLYDHLLDYDKVAHHYINLNEKTQKEYYEKSEEEELKGKGVRFQGKTLYDFQKSEFLDLMNIKVDSRTEQPNNYRHAIILFQTSIFTYTLAQPF